MNSQSHFESLARPAVLPRLVSYPRTNRHFILLFLTQPITRQPPNVDDSLAADTCRRFPRQPRSYSIHIQFP